MLLLLCSLAISGSKQTPHLESNGLWGYINMTAQTPPAEYGYGVSLYTAAWPLLEKPISGFQIGLAGTWILPDNHDVKFPLVPHGTVARDSMPERGPSFWTVFQTIEGGLGFWASNKYLTASPKFRMNGSVDGYNHEVSTPGWDFYGKPLPSEYMGIAQLSNRILVPPDGLTLAKDTLGELFGYAWMALPIMPAHKTAVKTGNQSWTLFLNAKNFRGPVAFYLPDTWSKMSENYPPAVARGLDALPGIADSGAMEINTVPQLVSQELGGKSYAKIPALQFPADLSGKTVLIHNLTAYSKKALWDQVLAWQNGGPTPDGKFDAGGSFLPEIKANPVEVKQGNEWARNVTDWVQTIGLDAHTFGVQWSAKALSPWRGTTKKGSFPTYYRHEGKAVEAISESDVPDATQLVPAQFPEADRTQSYQPSEGGEGPWTHPGPVAGPFKAKLVDGSTVTYYWYRFVDQPALRHLHLSRTEREKLQSLVEKLQKSWTPDKQYMAPPKVGHLAPVDSAVLVTPPSGLKLGYVPVAMRQNPSK